MKSIRTLLIVVFLSGGYLHAMSLADQLNMADDVSLLKNTQCNWIKGFGITFTLGSGYYLLENIVRDQCSNGACPTYAGAAVFGLILTAFAYWQDYEKLKRDIKFPIRKILPLLRAIKERQNDFFHIVQEVPKIVIPNGLRDFTDAIDEIQNKRNKLARFMIMAERGGKLSEALQDPLPKSTLFPLRLPKDVAEIVCKYVRGSSQRELEYTNDMEVSRYEIEEYRLRSNSGGRELRE